MNPKTWLHGVGATIAALVLGVVIGLSWGTSKANAKIQALQIQSANIKGQEDAVKSGEVADAQKARDEAIQHQAEADQRSVDAGRTVQALKAKLASITPTNPNTGSTIPPVGNVDIGNSVDISAQLRISTQIIAAMDVQHVDDLDRIKARDERIKAIESKSDGLEKALKLADLRADIQEQAANAAIRGMKQAKWLGRAEGVALGLAVGYAGGRLR